MTSILFICCLLIMLTLFDSVACLLVLLFVFGVAHLFVDIKPKLIRVSIMTSINHTELWSLRRACGSLLRGVR